ncbi:MAG: hypothetical protein K1060chlam3_00856 [Candidatus Anoxychlamydiales bacterium]|nr:hypothetical protein [Candidatus Anoxychlamydiales bacterium]
MKYKILFAEKLEKQLKKISKIHAKKIIERINNLSIDPRPYDIKKIVGKNLYRIRCGNYRIVYFLKDNTLVVLIILLAHRKDIYRDLK